LATAVGVGEEPGVSEGLGVIVGEGAAAGVLETLAEGVKLDEDGVVAFWLCLEHPVASKVKEASKIHWVVLIGK
jgi:hypothetical protein